MPRIILKKNQGLDIAYYKNRFGIFGRYILRNDTILGQRINTSKTEGAVYTDMYIILNRNQIKDLGDGLVYTFIPLENRLDSTNWLLKKKWFWTKEAWERRKKQ